MTNMTPTLPDREEAVGRDSDGDMLMGGSYLSDPSHPTKTPSNACTAEQSSRSRSPQKLGHSHSSVSATVTLELPLNGSFVTYDSTRRQKDFPKQSHGDEPDSRSRDDSEKLEIVLSHPRYQKLRRELDEERGRQKQYEDKLSEKDTRLAEIQSKAESDLKEKHKELDEVRKGRRKLAGELNKIRAKGQGFYQVTDSYLTDKTKSLRYSIRNFAIQYFDVEWNYAPSMKDPQFVHHYVKPVIPLQPTASYQHLLASPTSCSLLIQGILWQALNRRVFNCFIWAGEVTKDVRYLYETLSPTSRDTPPNAEAERKFCTWSATTTNLLLEKLDLKEGGDAYERLKKEKSSILNRVSEAIRPYANNHSGFDQELLKIIGDATALDLELSRQVARVIWVHDGQEFDACTMTSKERESSQTGKNDVHLLVAPGLKKRGKSTGEDFKTETCLLPMDVTRASVPVHNTLRRMSYLY